ncbi:MAG: hypothetical protein HeimC3_07860 [Candidatus Heimdallarchaeota archaeon LC_3]|nr:MAG: hypothetical protein HeimC3_07860 [Candidatus Heimdallarchaeota archaeon LC_3]
MLLDLLPASLGIIAASSAGISGLIIISLTGWKEGLKTLFTLLLNDLTY